MSSTISTLGTQSGMDLKSVIDAMVSNYKSTLETSVTTQKKLMEVQISGISTLKSNVSTFSDKVSKLLKDDSYTPVSVSGRRLTPRAMSSSPTPTASPRKVGQAPQGMTFPSSRPRRALSSPQR